MERCRATNQAGKPCAAEPLPSGWCRWHDPELEEARREWSRRGGHNKSNAARARKALPAGLTPDELHRLLGAVLKSVIAGRTEPGVGNAAANISRAIVVVKEAGELAERVEALAVMVHALVGRRTG